MFIITIIPISRGIGKETLTYFTADKVALGSLVLVPIRGKKSHGLVVEIKEASEAKMELKNLSYAMKKIEKVEQHFFLQENFVEATRAVADYYAATVGAVLSVLVPKSILESNISPRAALGEETSPTLGESSVVGRCEPLLLQTGDEERYGAYKSVIREEFARGRSVFFCLPTIEDIKNFGEQLQKGIENYTFILHGRLTKKEIQNVWQKILEEKHTVLIIATGSFLSLPRSDIGTIIVEKESSRTYKTQSRPFLDIRTVAEIVARKTGARLIFGDQLLQTETIWKQKNGDYAELSPLSFRSLSTCDCKKVDMRAPADMQKKDFKILSEDLKKMFLSARENSERTFIFCGRKGLFPQTVCADCGTQVVCKNCGAPVVLYKRKSGDSRNPLLKNLFVCHHCGERRDADVLCENCRGWRLLPLGIGIQNVAEEIKKILPKSEIFTLDAESVTTYKKATKIRDDFFATPGSVLVGTEMALSFLNQNVENSVVASLDSFFSIPDFKISEKVFHILLQMRALTSQKMLVQTRQPDLPLFDQALSGNLIDFYRDQIAERKNLNYPPFVKFIKLSIQGNKVAIKKQMEEIAAALKPFELSVFEAFNPGPQNKSVVHGLLSVSPESWPEKGLLEKLRVLPQFVQIKIDPDTLL